MSNPDDYIEQIHDNLMRNEKALPRDLELIEAAIREFPDLAELWILRGDLIQLSDEGGVSTLRDAETSYLKAIELEPENPEGYESLGFYYDVVMADPVTAKAQFERAIDLGAGESAQEGLADVMDQIG
jgi:hypothetical protein